MIENVRQFAAAEKEMCRLNYAKGFWPKKRILEKYGEIGILEDSIRSLQSQLDNYKGLLSGSILVDLSIIEKTPILLIQGRITACLTQQELADLAGISRQQVNRFERTRYRTASHRTIVRIKQVLEYAISSERQTIKDKLKYLRLQRTNKVYFDDQTQ